MDPLTTWVLLIVVAGPWTVGAFRLVRLLVDRLDRMDREEPLYEPDGRIAERYGRDR